MAEASTGTLLQERLREVIADAGTPIVHVGSHWLNQGARRMDAGYYSSASARASLALEALGVDVSPLGNMVDDCFILGRFKRIYAESPEVGYPYLSPTEAFQFRPTSTRWIAHAYAPKAPENHFAKEGWILVSASGTVGRPILVGSRLAGFFLSHDVVRIVPSDSVPAGYLYAYLASWIGQALLTRDRYGSAIKHLEDHHVANVPVPLLPDTAMYRIADHMQQAQTLREEANRLLDEATEKLYKELELPRTPATTTDVLPRRAFAALSSELHGRLDASFHDPVATATVNALKSGKYAPGFLDAICERIFHPGRFKRNYVTSEYGVPFIQGSHISLVKPFGIKHLAKTDERNLKRCRVGKHWVLVTRSGTIGKVSVVSSIAAGSAASEHLIRCVADESDYNPGYIALFLMTDYGQYQIQSKVYGAVVDELTEVDLGEVLIPDAPKDAQDTIGDKVLEAFEHKERANLLEEGATRALETLIPVP